MAWQKNVDQKCNKNQFLTALDRYGGKIQLLTSPQTGMVVKFNFWPPWTGIRYGIAIILGTFNSRRDFSIHFFILSLHNFYHPPRACPSLQRHRTDCCTPKLVAHLVRTLHALQEELHPALHKFRQRILTAQTKLFKHV